MAKMRGSFFALSGFLLASLVLALALLFSDTLDQSNKRLMESGGLERVQMLERSLGRTIRSIDNGISLSMESVGDPPTNTKINISELINGTFGDYGSDFYTSLLNLKASIEAEQPEITINPEVVYNSNEKIPIIFKPYNIRYTHYSLNNKTAVRLTTDVVNYNYEINFDLLEELINQDTNISWTIQNKSSDDFHLSVFMSAKDYSGYSTFTYENISITGLNQFRVGECILDINQISPTSLEVECAKATNLNLVIVPIALEEMVTANYPEGLVIMNFSDLSILKNRSVRLG